MEICFVRPDVLSCRCRLGLCLSSSPFGRQDAFTFGKVVESGIVVVEPEEELQVLCGVLNVLEVIHKVANCAWLVFSISMDCIEVLLGDDAFKGIPGKFHC